MSSTPAVQQDAVQAILKQHWSTAANGEDGHYEIEKLIKPSQNYTYLAVWQPKEAGKGRGGGGGGDQLKVIVRAIPQAKAQLDRIEGEAAVLHFLKTNHPELPTTNLIPMTATTTSSSAESSPSRLQGQYIAVGEQNLGDYGGDEGENNNNNKNKKKDPTLAVTVCSFASGREVNITGGEWMTSSQIAYHAGRWLGRLHKCMVNASSRSDSGAASSVVGAQVRDWRELHDGVMREIPVDPRDEALKKDPNHFGVLHGDVNCSNYFLMETTTEKNSSERGGEEEKNLSDLFVFDWDQVQLGWFMYDLAQVCHGVEMMQVGGAPWLPIVKEKEEGEEEKSEDATTTPAPPQIVGYKSIDGVPENAGEAYTKRAVEGYEAGRNDGGGDSTSPSQSYVVDWDHLERMKDLRQSFYRAFAVRELANPTLPEGMQSFCRYIVHADEKMTKQKEERKKK